ncbi:MAG: LAGLIDADG family homing endonuclease, partial [Actinomycetota bacterium]
WHTCSNTSRINASNPCFTGDSQVHTDKGEIRFDRLMQRVIDGETFEVFTHNVTSEENPERSVQLSKPTQFMVTGVNEILRLDFSDGHEIRCTPNHRLWTVNRGWVRADDLAENDEVQLVDLPTGATMADYSFGVSTSTSAYASKHDKHLSLNFPEKWTEEFAHYVGWLVGDGCISGNVVSTIYGSAEDQEEVLPRHIELLKHINGGRAPKPSRQLNGTVQLRMSRRPFRLFLEALGVKAVKAADKEVPWSLFEAPDEIVRAFLTGLYDADGCVYNGSTTRYVGLGSKSKELLRGAQLLLQRFGINGRIYSSKRREEDSQFSYARKSDGEVVRYSTTGDSFDLRILGDQKSLFYGFINFDLDRKTLLLSDVVNDYKSYTSRRTARLTKRNEDGFELTFNLTEPINHSYLVNGVVVSNCSEYMHVDNSSCNLASLNLIKFLDDDDNFDVEGYKHGVEVMFLAQEISVGFASYPTEKIGENSRRFRQLGQGYANLGALLMAQGLPYDSDEGRAWAGAITSIMTGHCYATSAKIAKRVGAFEAYASNREPMVRVINKHRDAAYEIPEGYLPDAMVTAARSSWDEALALGEKHGYRNSQATVLAPTGTIGLLMDCDTTGIEPDLALKKTKKLVGGGTMSIVNQTVPRGLRKLGYSADQVAEIVAFIDDNSHVIDAPHMRDEHMGVFDTAMGERSISYMGHIRMMSAAQPFLSGAISKTVNLPEEVTVEDVEQAYIEGWRGGLKALAIYRDNCKVAQPLSSTKKEKADAAKLAGVTALPEPVRRRLPKKRMSRTIKFRVADTEGYITVGEFPDGSVGELFLKVAKQGSTLAGIMDAFAISISMGLQYGVPLSAYVKQFVNTRFEPSGMTDDPDFRIATSVLDYVFRVLAVEYLNEADRHSLGIRTAGERQTEIETKLDPNATGDKPDGNGNGGGNGNGKSKTATPASEGVIVLGNVASASVGSHPFCGTCGVQMQPAGSCFACPSCGSTSGCS